MERPGKLNDRVAIREVGMRDGLQSIAEIMPTETKLAWLDAEYAAGVREIEVTSFVPPKLLPQLADAEAVVRHALTLPGLTVSALIPNSRGAERGLALGVHEMNFVLSVSEGHNRSNVRRGTDELIEDFRRVVQICRERGGREPAPDQLRARDLVRLHDRGRCGRGPGQAHRQRGRRGRCRRHPLGRHGRVWAAGGDRARLPQDHRRCRAAAGLRAFPRHARARPCECAGGLRGRVPRRSTPRSAGSADARMRPARPATSCSKTPRSCSRRWGSRPASISSGWRQVRELVARRLPGVTMHGAIAKAGLPRNFHPVAQAA